MAEPADTPAQDHVINDHVVNDTMTVAVKNHILTSENSYKILSEQVYIPE